jgi:hypothetical protein
MTDPQSGFRKGHSNQDYLFTIKESIYRVSRKWRTSDALRCRRDYPKREKNVKKILLDLFADLAVFENGI